MIPSFPAEIYLVQRTGPKEIDGVIEEDHFIGYGPRHYDTTLRVWVEDLPAMDGRPRAVVESEEAVIAALEHRELPTP